MGHSMSQTLHSFVQRVLEHTAYLAEEQGNHGLGQHCAAVTTEH